MPTNYGQQVSGSGISRSEKVNVANGGDGKWHYIDRQNLGNSCGPACVRMVVQMVKGVRIGEAYFGGLIAVAESGATPQTVNPLSDTAVNSHNFSAAGTLSDYLLTALRDAKVSTAKKADSSTTNWGTVWGACSVKAPAIISVAWTGGNAHFIVVAGPLSGSTDKILILDPAYGIQQLSLTAPTTYTPRMGGGSTGLILATGNLQVSPGNWVEVITTN
jgi:hypothetical protein